MSKIHPDTIKEKLYEDFKGIYGDALISMFIYGHAAETDYDAGSSIITAAAVLKNASLAEIEKCQKIRNKWLSRKVSVSYFFTMNFIESSLDVFPVEFYNMKEVHIMAGGEDILSGMKIDKEHLRLQCERELRGLVLHMRSQYLEACTKLKKLDTFIKNCLATFNIIFRGLVYLKQDEVPKTLKEIIHAIEEQYGIGNAISSVYNRKITNNIDSYKSAFEDFMGSVEKLTKIVDTL
ncbi:hypothetical protein ACFL6D_05395 [Spirochaetota bacterium]